MTTILDKIVRRTREDLQLRKSAKSLDGLRAEAATACLPRDFRSAITRPGEVRLIAEVKQASPSKGIIRADFDPVSIATQYANSGAAAISVLTDEPFFQGHLDYLRRIRKAVDLPLLRKDFIVDPYQVWEARAAGADAVLLIAECLPQPELEALYALSRELGMHVLLELYEPTNLPRCLATGCPIIGINNRDLRSFEVDLGHTLRLRPQIGEDRSVVSESGIHSPDDVQLLHANRIDAMLVGESLMRQPDIAAAVRRLLAG